MTQKNEKSVVNNAIFSVIKAFVTLFLPLITFPYASRILLPEGIGKVNFANSIVSYFIIMAEFGVGRYATREASKLRNNKALLSKFTTEMLTINIISTLISYCLFFTAVLNIPKLSDYRVLLFVCSGKIFFMTAGMDWFFNAIEDFKYITIRSMIFQIIGVIFLFVFVRTKDDYVEYAIFGMISSVGSNICNIFHATKFVNINFTIKKELKKHLKPIIVFFGITLICCIYEILDTSMLGFLSNDREVGLYSAGIKINKMVVEVLTAITTVFLPRLAVYYKENDKTKFYSLSKNGFNFIVMLALPMIAGIIALSDSLVHLFCGTEYLSADNLMKIISPILIFVSLSNLMGTQMLPAINKERISIISYAAAAVCNISLNLILIPKFGSIGAAIGTVFAEGTSMLIQILYFRKVFFTKETVINFIEALISSVIMYIVLILIFNFIENYILRIIAGVLTGVLVYFILLMACKNKMLLMVIEKLKYKLKRK